MNCWVVPSSVWEGCGCGVGGMPATRPCEGGHGRGGEEEEEEMGRGGGGEDMHVEHSEVEERERERDSDGGAEEESPDLFFTISPSPFLSPASRDRIRYRHIWMDG